MARKFQSCLVSIQEQRRATCSSVVTLAVPMLACTLALATALAQELPPEPAPGAPADDEVFSELLPGWIDDAAVPPTAPLPAPAIDARSLEAATLLSLEPAYVQGVRDGLWMVYRHAYTDANQHFEALDGAHPGTGIGPVVDAMIWQTQMLENDDLRYVERYDRASERAHAQLEGALADKAHQAWDHFLMATLLGMDAVHAYRAKDSALAAAKLGYDAMRHASAARDESPGFVDPLFAEGLYLYGSTVLAEQSLLVQSTGDHRRQGIALLEQVQADAALLQAPAKIALARVLHAQHDNRGALGHAQSTARQFPNNVLNNLVLAEIQTSLRDYDGALEALDRVLRVSPANQQAQYLRAVAYQRAGKPDKARVALAACLDSPHLLPPLRAEAHLLLGHIELGAKRYPEARAHYEEALVHEAGHPGAERALTKLERAIGSQ